MNKGQQPTKFKITEYIITGVILLIAIVMLCLFGSRSYSFELYENSSVDYVSGEVLEVISQDFSDPNENRYVTGRQLLKVEITEGERKGEVIEIYNYITPTFQVIPEQGSNIIVRADTPQGIEPLYSVYSYNRTLPIFLIITFFLLLVILVGRKKGFMSCVGLLFTLAMVICYLLPGLYEGGNAFWHITVTMVLSSLASCFCISGSSARTLLNFIGVVIGSLSAVLIYWIFTLILNITGASMSEAENLLLISYATNLDLNGILFAGVAVSALGAVMDVAVSMGASLYEIKELNPQITPKALFRSGMNIGKEMIGTMTNTLILAFAGGTIATLLIFISYGVQFHQLMSSDFMALEIATGIAGSAAVVLTVPISAMVCAFGLGKNIFGKTKKRGNQ